MKIDSHQHFWKYSPTEYPWIDHAKTRIARDYLPDDLEVEQCKIGFDGSIAVQARQTIKESEWLLSLADSSPRIKGVVGWMDLRSPSVGAELARLSAHQKFVGVRHVVQDEPDANFMLGADFLRGLQQLKQFSLVYDLLVFPHQLPACIEVARRFPHQTFVLDHLAKPSIAAGALHPWESLIRQLSKFPNVSCKISGMVTEARWGAWQAKDFSPYISVVWDAFGPDRIMFGSDWPVSLLSGTYEQVHEIADGFIRNQDSESQEKFYWRNAQSIYRLFREGP